MIEPYCELAIAFDDLELQFDRRMVQDDSKWDTYFQRRDGLKKSASSGLGPHPILH